MCSDIVDYSHLGLWRLRKRGPERPHRCQPSRHWDPRRRSISFRGAGRARSELQFRAGSRKAAIAEFWRAMFLRKASWIMQEIEGILPYGRLDGSISLLLGMEKATVRFDCFTRRLQRELQRFPRDARNERLDHPAESRRNVPRQRSHFALQVNAAVALLHPPPGFHSPEISAVVPRRFLAFVAFPGVFHFRDAHGRAPAVRLPRCIMEVVHCMLRVQHHGDHLVPAKTQENLKMIVTP